MNLVSDAPFTYCLVRNEFLYNQTKGHGEYTECCIFGVVALEGRAPMFSAMLRNGAIWARLPIHAFCFEPSEPLPIYALCLWDALSYDVTVHKYAYLETLVADVFCSDGEQRKGHYLFTLDWCKSDYSEMPDQHKQHHIFRLETGHVAAMPGNRLRWHEPSWVQPYGDRPDYMVNTHEFTTERERAIIHSDLQFYRTESE